MDSGPPILDPAYPVQLDSPLNRGLVEWFLATPQIRPAAVWRGLLGKYRATATGTSGVPAFVGQGRYGEPGAVRGVTASGHCWPITNSWPAANVVIPVNGVVPFAVSMWMKWDGVSNAKTLFSMGQNGSFNEYHGFQISNAIRAYSGSGGASGFAAGTTIIAPNIWYHTFAVWESAASRKIYVNGKLEGTNTTSLTPTGMGKTCIGGFATNNGDTFGGDINDVRLYSIAQTADEVRAIYDDSRNGYRKTLNRFAVWSFGVAASGGGPTYTLSADSGSFALTGNAAALKADRKLAVATGSLILTGNAAGLVAGRKLTASAGSFNLTGNATGLVAGRKLTTGTGSFALAGSATGIVAARKIIADTSSFALTGHATNLVYTPTGGPTYTLTANAGSFALAGGTTGMAAGRKLAAAAGSFNLAGQSVGLTAGRRIAAACGEFTLTSQVLNVLASRRITAATGSFILTGNAAGLTYSNESGPTPRRICGLSAAYREYSLSAAYREYDLSARGCEC